MSASGASEGGDVTLLRYFDVVLVIVGAPILLLIGVPAVGYGVGAGTWIVLRAIGVLLERYAARVPNKNTEITVRLTYLLGRIFVLALAVILVRQNASRNDALTALLVIVFAFTIGLGLSYANRPGAR